MELIKGPAYSLNMWLAKVFDIDQNIVQIYNDKDIKLLYKNLIDIVLKVSKSIRKSKKYDLVLKIVVLSPKAIFYLLPLQIFIW